MKQSLSIREIIKAHFNNIVRYFIIAVPLAYLGLSVVQTKESLNDKSDLFLNLISTKVQNNLRDYDHLAIHKEFNRLIFDESIQFLKLTFQNEVISTVGVKSLNSLEKILGAGKEIEHLVEVFQGENFKIEGEIVNKNFQKNLLVFLILSLVTALSFVIPFLIKTNNTLKVLEEPVQDLSSMLDGSGIVRDEISIDKNTGILEYDLILDGLRNQFEKTIEIEEEKAKSEKMAVFRQIAHDLKSPLAALKVICDMPQGDEQGQLLMKEAIKRIDNVCSDLHKKQKIVGESLEFQKNNLSEVIKLLLKEKELTHPKIEFKIIYEDSQKDFYSHFIKAQLERVLSNILNNSIEARSTEIKIKLTKKKQGENVNNIISINDNGDGIPEDKIELVVHEGYTSGKETGSGLGLSYGRKVLKELKGSLNIRSVVGKGTSVELSLPQSNYDQI